MATVSEAERLNWRPGARIWVWMSRDTGGPNVLRAATVIRYEPDNRRVLANFDGDADDHCSVVSLLHIADDLGAAPPRQPAPTPQQQRIVEEMASHRQAQSMARPIHELTPDTEALLAVLLRPQTLAEQAWADVLRAIVTGDKAARLGAAAALADLVKAELEE